MRTKIVTSLLAIVLLSATAFASASSRSGLAGYAQTAPDRAYIIREVRHELITLPYYNLFDWLQYEVGNDGTVTLLGEVVRPVTKSDAEAAVKGINGVSRVINRIEVLPVSPMDDQLRIALYRAIYGWDSPLFHYGTQVVPPIHIIVSNGRVTLKGVVASKADAEQAYIRARSVPGSFDVRNEIQVEAERSR